MLGRSAFAAAVTTFLSFFLFCFFLLGFVWCCSASASLSAFKLAHRLKPFCGRVFVHVSAWLSLSVYACVHFSLLYAFTITTFQFRYRFKINATFNLHTRRKNDNSRAEIEREREQKSKRLSRCLY